MSVTIQPKDVDKSAEQSSDELFNVKVHIITEINLFTLYCFIVRLKMKNPLQFNQKVLTNQ